MRRWRIGLPVVAVGLLLAGCGVAHERSARSVVPDTPVGLVVGSRLTLPLTTLDPDRQVLHVLNRLAYGPRPGDVERVRAMGLAAWIERQLEPERIPDELVERRLGAYPTLRMTTAELFQEFPRPDPSASTRRRGRCAAARRRCGTGWRARRGSAAPRIATELAAARLAMA
jgi:hypothetical protein